MNAVERLFPFFVFINYFLEYMYMYMPSLLKKIIIEIYMQYFYYYNFLGIHMFALPLPISITADTRLAVLQLYGSVLN